MHVLFVLAVMAAITAGAAILRGVVLSVLWSWFVVPVFAAPHLPVAAAIGLAMIVGMFRKVDHEPEYAEEIAGLILAELFTPVVVLAMGAIVRGFMP